MFLYHILFLSAGVYNLAFAGALATKPKWLFGIFNETCPLPEPLIIPLATGIGLFAPVYFYAARRPCHGRSLIGLALLSKLFPSLAVGLLFLVAGWSPGLFKMIFFNDMLWWLPFLAFLRKRQAKPVLPA